ncbi:uncharacterized protein LOC124293088 isoform X3 [Neodiprion lecontei]|uniref:Uncharacterized protein LOC124293088 isoform X3 n=1 Tax=Neodiprion lecontei TaxID=441921 RepID=A0ABM3FK24_NEOLC|nr:uncharacterized protein LOC124293088 isoform X3 [Neodiprion lecontei]
MQTFKKNDGASWNRGVWEIFGVDENNISCEHPCDSLRRLRMISDFNHLLKCFRTSTLDDRLQEFKTPYGTVEKRHWEALLEEENYRQPNMKIAYKLTPAHLKPNGFQAMNVPLATEVFGHEVSVAMAHYQPMCNKLKDSTPTQKFIDLIFNLVQAMSSHIPGDALYAKDDCRNKQAILKFLQFYEDWEKFEKKIPVSRSTSVGLKVTLRATLEILDMLKDVCDSKYLMTATLSQDPLERFFSVMRYSCGGNDHPDPKMFAQVYRLASSFSLIRPPRGCNVSGTDLLKSPKVIASAIKHFKEYDLDAIFKENTGCKHSDWCSESAIGIEDVQNCVDRRNDTCKTDSFMPVIESMEEWLKNPWSTD